MEFVLGTAQLQRAYGAARRRDRALNPNESRSLLEAAIAHGVVAVDTAPAYGGAEEAIGQVAGLMRVHTKIDPALNPKDSLAGSLARLRRSHVEILYLHDPAEVLHRDGPVLRAAHALVGARVGMLGASVYDLEEFDAATADERVGAIQVPLNVLDRHIDEDRLAYASGIGTRIYARSVLLQGVLVAPPAEVTGVVDHLRRYVEALHELTQQLGRPVLELALGWIRALPGVHGLVIGVESVRNLEGIVGAMQADPLSESELAALRSLPVPLPGTCDPRRWGSPVR